MNENPKANTKPNQAPSAAPPGAMPGVLTTVTEFFGISRAVAIAGLSALILVLIGGICYFVKSAPPAKLSGSGLIIATFDRHPRPALDLPRFPVGVAYRGSPAPNPPPIRCNNCLSDFDIRLSSFP